MCTTVLGWSTPVLQHPVYPLFRSPWSFSEVLINAFVLMSIVTVPMTVHIETDPAQLPNGPYCTGGFQAAQMTKVDVYLGENPSMQQLDDILMKQFVNRLVDSAVTKKTYNGRSTTEKAPANITGRNTVEVKGPAGKMMVELHIREIRYKGGPAREVVAGDGYEVSLQQLHTTKSSFCTIC